MIVNVTLDGVKGRVIPYSSHQQKDIFLQIWRYVFDTSWLKLECEYDLSALWWLCLLDLVFPLLLSLWMNTATCCITSFVPRFLEKRIHIIAFRAQRNFLRIIQWLDTVSGKELSKVCCQNRKVHPPALKCSDTGTFLFYSLELLLAYRKSCKYNESKIRIQNDTCGPKMQCNCQTFATFRQQ